jgi:hypothetical protein
MVVVPHQAVGVAEPVEPLDHRSQDLKELSPVLIVEEDILPSVPAGGDVVHRPFIFDAQWACQGQS